MTTSRTIQDAIQFVKSELADLIHTNKLTEDEIATITCTLLKFAKQNMENVIEECRIMEKRKNPTYTVRFHPSREKLLLCRITDRGIIEEAEISKRADWVKEGHCFIEEDIRFWNVVKHKGSETRAPHPTLINRKGVSVIAKVRHPHTGNFH